MLAPTRNGLRIVCPDELDVMPELEPVPVPVTVVAPVVVVDPAVAVVVFPLEPDDACVLPVAVVVEVAPVDFVPPAPPVPSGFEQAGLTAPATKAKRTE
jgi:hypothetical protein